MTEKDKKVLKENREIIAQLALDISDKYSKYCPDPELLITSLVKLLYQGFSIADLKSGQYDGIIIDKYKEDSLELDKKMDLKMNNRK